LNQRPLGYEPNELPDCSTPLSEQYTISRLHRGGSPMQLPYAVALCSCPMQLPQLNLSEGWPAMANAERDRQRRSDAKRAVRAPPREVFMFGAQVGRQSPMNGSFTG